MSEIYKIPSIRQESITDLQVSGLFYKRLTGLYFNYAEKCGAERFKELCEHIAKNQIDTIANETDKGDAYSIETLLMLLKTLEDAFAKANLIEEIDVEVPTEGSK